MNKGPNKIIYQDKNITKILLESSKFGNKECIIDTEDYDKIKKYRWWISKKKKDHTFYVMAHIYYGKERLKKKLHRIILNIDDSKILVDHKNFDGLDNRKNNLRSCTYQENAMNRQIIKTYSSKYKGVCLDKAYKKWVANIKFNDKTIYLGRFNDEEQAAKAYNEKAKELFGKFSCLNEIKGE